MSDHLSVTLTGVDGTVWSLSGPNAGIEGVELRPGPTKLIDAPAKTFWIQSAGPGMTYQGRQFERRDPVFSVQIHADTADEWRDIDSRFRLALGMYDDEFTITYETADGARHLDLRLLQEPTAYGTADYERGGSDPHLWRDSTLAIAAAAAQPFWYGESYTESWVLPSGTSGSGLLHPRNFGDVPVWPSYMVTAPATWTIADYSWGQESIVQRPEGADATRTVPLPALLPGEDTKVNADPNQEQLIAANGALVWARWGGRGLLYPIGAKTQITPVPVGVVNAPTGAAITMTVPRRYSRPLGVSL